MVGAIGAGAGPTAAATRPLPPGCNLQYGGQTITAKGGRAVAFSFQGYNAVPPGHKATAARISWGDGKTTTARVKTHTTAFLKGCYATDFNGRHTYPTRTLCKAGLCSKTYHVVVRYSDAQTHAHHTLNKLKVIIVRTKKS
jgi:hypothetical protein